MAWWQGKFLNYGLRYFLSRTGFLDERAIEAKDLDIRLGRNNVVELKDVGLNVKRISKLLHLPPGLRIETARVLSLRLNVPADIWSSSIVAEIDGIEVVARIEEVQNTQTGKGGTSGSRSPVVSRSPQHRKVHRRIPSPPPYDPGGFPDSDEDDAHMPTTHEMAMSFLQQEPANERREMEASVAADDSKSMEGSFMSESSQSDSVGVDTGTGLPGFLENFCKGIQDRIEVHIKNIDVKLETELPGDSGDSMAVTLRLQIPGIDLERLDSLGAGGSQHSGKRHITLSDIAVDLLTKDTVFSELSEPSSRSSPTTSKEADHGVARSSVGLGGSDTAATSPIFPSGPDGHISEFSPLRPENTMAESTAIAFDGREDALNHQPTSRSLLSEGSDLDIQPGDDNVSWGSRRSKSEAPADDDLWKSMTSDEDELPDSLLLERAATPRAHSSRPVSPAAVRSRRAVSPYDRSLRSPDSWPRADHSPEHRNMPQGPGSWPTLDQSEHSIFQPLTPGPALDEEDPLDNKRQAIQASVSRSQQPPEDDSEQRQLLESEGDQLEDLTQSRIFSHQDAESMYMSAMSYSPDVTMPGGWAQDIEDRENANHAAGHSSIHLKQSAEAQGSVLSLVQEEGEPRPPPSGNATPRARSPDIPAASFAAYAAKRLLSVDSVSLWLPSSPPASREGPVPATRLYPKSYTGTKSTERALPGSFSAYSELAASRRVDAASADAQRTVDAASEDGESEIVLGTVKMATDISCCRLLYRLVHSASRSFSTGNETANAKPSRTPERPSTRLALSATMKSLRLSLLEQLPYDSRHKMETELIAIACENLSLSAITEEMDLRLGRFQAFVSGSELLAFDHEASLNKSTLVMDNKPDVFACASSSKRTIHGKPITEITLETLPLKVNLDMGAIDDTLSCLGGLGNILELSNSVFSEGGAIGSAPKPASKSVRGVRFQDNMESSASPEIKFNATVGGADLTLRGQAVFLNLRTSKIKAIYRQSQSSATVTNVVISGPYNSGATKPPIFLDIAGIRLEFLTAPAPKDLERLLVLVNPSKDRYDDDDEILLPRLLEQRKKGSLLRISIGDVKFKTDDWECLEPLTALGSELTRLSAVTKYLPDDDRPGLMSLLKIKSFEAHLPVNPRFGKLRVLGQDFHCAHVGAPALLAFSLDQVAGNSSGGQGDLIHPLVPLSSADNLPMLMLRNLGGEETKIKLFNVCVEYSVPIVLALTGMDVAKDTDEFVMELAQSVANMAMQTDAHVRNESRPQNGSTSKRTKLDVLIHDSAIGLTPDKLRSKGILALTDATFATNLPPEGSLEASLDLKRAALFAIDNAEPVVTEATATRRPPSNHPTDARLAVAMSQAGYVSLGSFRSTHITAKIVDEISNDNDKTVEINMRSELLLLETCPDSTQTLLEIFGGLAPPTPPSKAPKYLTQPMTIEDMMASFTGEPENKPAQSPDTLFDADDSHSNMDEPLLLSAELGSDRTDLLIGSQMTSSLYGPVSGMLGGVDKPVDDDEPDTDDFADTAESLLEEDPFEMPSSLTDFGMTDAALMRDLSQQCKPAFRKEPADLGTCDIEDLGFDALGANQQALGSEHRFSRPITKGSKLPRLDPNRKLPFSLRLRDANLIWHIHDGYDWRSTREGITQAVEQVEMRVEERNARRQQSLQERGGNEAIVGDVLFNSIYIGVPSNHDAQELRRQINHGIGELGSETESQPISAMSRPTSQSASGRPHRQRRLRLGRSRSHKASFELKNVSADVVVFPPDGGDIVSSVDVRVKDFEIYDNIPTSTWRKFLTRLNDDTRTRELSKPMIHIEMFNVKTLRDYSASEIILHASVLPLRLHVDQDALDFIIRFFSFKDDKTAKPSTDEQPFLQRLEVDTVDLRLDYKPKRVDYASLRSGSSSELMNFVQLEDAPIQLKHTIVYGLRGFEPIHKTLNDIWMPDVTGHQLPRIIAGLASVRSLSNIGAGLRDVVAIPVREYRKDGRIVRSIQKGAFHFGKTTASELARLGAKIAIGSQNMLQGTEGLLTPASASPRPTATELDDNDDETERRAISAYANQPLGIFSGLRAARQNLEHDLLTAKDAIIAVQGELVESATPGAAAAAIARHAPTVILRPVIGATRAVGDALLGVGNQIDRSNVRRIDDKYKRT